jgi:hypothetical protein
MAGLGGVDHVDDTETHLDGLFLQIRDAIVERSSGSLH